MPIIGCGIPSWQLLTLLINPGVNQIVNVILNQFDLSLREKRSYILRFLHSIGKVLIGLFEFVGKLISHRSHVRMTQEKMMGVTTYKFDQVKLRQDYILWLIYGVTFLIGIWVVPELVFTDYSALRISLVDYLFTLMVQIAFISLLCFFFLNYKYYYHHALSYFILFLGFVFLLIGFILFDELTLPYSYIETLLVIPDSFEIIWDKWIMQNKGLSPLLVLFIEGLGSLLGSSTLIVILAGYQCDATWIKWFNICVFGEPVGCWSYVTGLFIGKNAVYAIIYMLLSGFMSLVTKLVIYYLTPTHNIITLILDFVFSYFIAFVLGGSIAVTAVSNALLGLSFAFLLLGSLFYNEVLLYYICGLERNTKKEIIKRGDRDDFEVLASMK